MTRNHTNWLWLSLVAAVGLSLTMGEYLLAGAVLFTLVILLIGGEIAFQIIVIGVSILLCGVLVLIWWLPAGFFGGISLETWISENWIIAAICLVSPLAGVWFYYGESDDAWDSLEEKYGSDLDHRLADKPCQRGGMIFGVSSYSIKATVARDGIVISRSKHLPLCFTWDEIRSVSQVGIQNKPIATIVLSTASPIPLKLRIPWNRRMSAWIPETVEHFVD